MMIQGLMLILLFHGCRAQFLQLMNEQEDLSTVDQGSIVNGA